MFSDLHLKQKSEIQQKYDILTHLIIDT
jgi:hypothetical protein